MSGGLGMNAMHTNDRKGERGSALILAILVTVILTLLGVSYLMMAETENKIAENERLSAQALYVAEGAARQVKRWFDRPMGATNLENPDPSLSIMNRTLRMIDADGDPGTTPVAADGTTTNPYYKQGIDLNVDGDDDFFEKPYRDDLFNTLMGTEDGPDIRIDEGFHSDAKTFLTDLSEALLANYPMGDKGLRSRITRIDIYAPPTIDVGGSWTRYGMGTVKVTARIYKDLGGGAEQVVAERMVKAVLNETPFPGPFGPLHSCDDLNFNGDFTVNWGMATAVSNSDLTNNHGKVRSSLAREIPAGVRLDKIYGWDLDTKWDDYQAALEGLQIEDPWFRFMSGGTVADSMCSTWNSVDNQPCPFVWGGGALGDEQQPFHGGPNDGTHSNVFQNMAMAGCPEFDYETWKGIAQSGGSDVHYYVWQSGTSFKENGFGTAETFRDITDDTEGLYFFDTVDGIEPYDNDSNGEYDNLTPEIVIQGGTWGARGFIYLNAENFQTNGLTGRAATFRAPGEPFQDENENGRFDAGERWINLNYPTNLTDPITAEATNTLQDDETMGGPGTEVRNTRGPSIATTAVLWGILYNNGYYEATGNARYYGSVISKQGVGETGPTAGTPEIYWDQTIVDNWPPPGWDLPRVVISRWETDL